MKAVFVIGAIKSGGAERVIVNLSNHLTEVYGDDITLVSIHSSEIAYNINHKVRFINGLGTNSELKAISSLHKVIKNENPDVVLSFMTHINIATIIAALGTKVPVVVSERNDPIHVPTEKNRRVLRKIIYPLAKGFVFQTEDAKAFFSKKIQNRSKVIINPVQVTKLPAPFSNRKKEIVTVGRLVKQKNQNMLLEAFSSSLPSFCDYTLHIYGDGPLESELKKKAEDLGIYDKVFFHGSVKDLHERIFECEVFVLSSDYEGMPNALMEAMALGLVCISTDCPCGGPKTLITHGQNGFLVPVGDSFSLAKILSEVLNDHEKMKMVSEQSIQRMEELNPNDIYNAWRNILIERSK